MQIPPLAVLGRNDSCHPGRDFCHPERRTQSGAEGSETQRGKLFILKKVLTLSGKNFS